MGDSVGSLNLITLMCVNGDDGQIANTSHINDKVPVFWSALEKTYRAILSV